MKITFIGTGSAFTVGSGNYHSNMLLQSSSGKNLLLDCGSDARLSLFELGFGYKDIHDVYVSHLHADHVGGLEWLAFSTKFSEEGLPKPLLHISEDLVDGLWEKVLSGGLSSLPEKKAKLSSYFSIDQIPVGHPFQWEGIEFYLIKTLHTMSDKIYQPCYGLLFAIHGKKIFITTDTQFTPEFLQNTYEEADLIFHDCETAVIHSECHSHFSDLKTLDPKIKEKMWLYHYQPGPLPDARKLGFKGFVKKGQSFEL